MTILPLSSSAALKRKYRCEQKHHAGAPSGRLFFCLRGRKVHRSVLYLIELDLKTKLIESGTTQTEVAEKVGVSLAYVNRITKGREQIVNKTFVKMMDELGYDVELTYKKKAAD